MSEQPTLSSGFLKSVISNPDISNPTPAILQITSIKPINTGAGTKYRVIISDGKHLAQGILSTQLNGLVESEDIKKYTVLHVRKFVVNVVQDKKIIFVLDVDIVSNDANAKIGSPIEIESEEGPTPPASPLPSPLPSPQKSPSKAPIRVPNFAPGSPEKTPSEAFPISSLNPYQGRWSIKARVSHKSDVKTWSNVKGSGKLFSITLVDQSGEIKATGFTDIVEKYYDQIEVGKIYIISRGSIKPAKKQYSTVKNDYEITFDQYTTIKLADDQDSVVPEVFYKFVSIPQLTSVAKDSIVDIIAIVYQVNPVTSINTKYQKDLSKRDLVLIDEGLHSVKITLWGSIANDFQESGNPVIAIKGVRVSDYGGVSLSTISGSVLQINPDIPEAHKLKGWYDNGGHEQVFNPLTVQQNFQAVDAPRKTVKEVETEKLGSQVDHPDTFSLKATVVVIPHEKSFYYTACPETGAKVVQNSNGWYCEKTNKTLPSCEYRYIMKAFCLDHSGGVWVNLFNDSAKTLIKKSAEELHLMKETGEMDSFEDAFKDAMFKSYIFKIRAKSEMYNGDQFTRYQVSSTQEIDYVNESKNLIASIKKLS